MRNPAADQGRPPDPLPPLPEALITFLDRRYPERCPDPRDSERTLWLKAGRREVVRYLLDQYERQQASGGPGPAVPHSFVIPLVQSCAVEP